MSKERVYILHKNGANSHYTGLKHLLMENNMELHYYEFSIFSKLFKSITKFRFSLFVKQLKNIYFFLSLLFTKNKKIVLGIAPFDSKLGKLLPFLKNHHVYYHSSWTYWDKTFHPNTKKNTPEVFGLWASFLEKRVQHHFVVTQQTKNQLIQNYNIEETKITVVAHSLKPAFLNVETNMNRAPNSFIYLGRLVPQKGIEEILAFFKENKNCQLTIVGNGKQKVLVEQAAKEHKNISYLAFTSNSNEIVKQIRSHEFMLLNSKATHKWEELFGLVVIESMSQGTIPVATSHSGPKEILTNNTGYLFKEGEMESCLKEVIGSGGFDAVKSKNCIAEAKKYSPENIAKRWNKILD